MGTSITEIVEQVRQEAQHRNQAMANAASALVAVGTLWERRLAEGWQPPDGSSFPWAQVRLSLSALVPGLKGERLPSPPDPHPPAPSPEASGEGEERGRVIVVQEGVYDAQLFIGKPSDWIVNRAKELRQNATTAERLLWEFVRGRRLHDRKFRRQHPMGRYIADFFCDDARLIIELDGGIHDQAEIAERDRTREEIISANRYLIVRFSNESILRDTERVLQTLSDLVTEHSFELTTRSSSPSPTAWERGPGGEGGGKVAALILAGNTPLMSWSPLCACLLAGFSVFVKMSREETLWPRLFVEALAEVAPEVASRIHLDVWPGEDERTTALVQSVDAVIAFGSDATIDALRKATPEETPFFGYGHSISIGAVLPEKCPLSGMIDPFSLAEVGDFALDILLYRQAGCLSLHTAFIDGDGAVVREVGAILAQSLRRESEAFFLASITDTATAYDVRQARDMALFSGAEVLGDEGLRWTVIAHEKTIPLPLPVGHCVVHLIPIENLVAQLPSLIAPYRGAISSVGVAGKIEEELSYRLRQAGVSRICKMGEMQMPPLDWPNGNVDLLAELLKC